MASSSSSIISSDAKEAKHQLIVSTIEREIALHARGQSCHYPLAPCYCYNELASNKLRNVTNWTVDVTNWNVRDFSYGSRQFILECDRRNSYCHCKMKDCSSKILMPKFPDSMMTFFPDHAEWKNVCLFRKDINNYAVYDWNRQANITLLQMDEKKEEGLSYFEVDGKVYFNNRWKLFTLYPEQKDVYTFKIHDQFFVKTKKYIITNSRPRDARQTTVELLDFKFQVIKVFDNCTVICVCKEDVIVMQEEDGSFLYYDFNRLVFIDDGFEFCGWLDKLNPNEKGLCAIERDNDSKLTIIKRFDKTHSNSECFVCNEDAEGNHFVLVPCGHTNFHENCIRDLSKCPICNIDISQKVKLIVP